ncbi:hypothetical protein T484DRAFT_3634396, partial [Baffinella frigidus]
MAATQAPQDVALTQAPREEDTTEDTTVCTLVLHQQRRANAPGRHVGLEEPVTFQLAATRHSNVAHVLGRGEAGKTPEDLMTAAIADLREALPAETVAQIAPDALLRDLSTDFLEACDGDISRCHAIVRVSLEQGKPHVALLDLRTPAKAKTFGPILPQGPAGRGDPPEPCTWTPLTEGSPVFLAGSTAYGAYLVLQPAEGASDEESSSDEEEEEVAAHEAAPPPLSTRSQCRESRIKLLLRPADQVGPVIGKGGSVIKRFNGSRCSVNVMDRNHVYPGTSLRLVGCSSGAADDVAPVLGELLDILASAACSAGGDGVLAIFIAAPPRGVPHLSELQARHSACT